MAHIIPVILAPYDVTDKDLRHVFPEAFDANDQSCQSLIRSISLAFWYQAEGFGFNRDFRRLLEGFMDEEDLTGYWKRTKAIHGRAGVLTIALRHPNSVCERQGWRPLNELYESMTELMSRRVRQRRQPAQHLSIPEGSRRPSQVSQTSDKIKMRLHALHQSWAGSSNSDHRKLQLQYFPRNSRATDELKQRLPDGVANDPDSFRGSVASFPYHCTAASDLTAAHSETCEDIQSPRTVNLGDTSWLSDLENVEDETEEEIKGLRQAQRP